MCFRNSNDERRIYEPDAAFDEQPVGESADRRLPARGAEHGYAERVSGGRPTWHFTTWRVWHFNAHVQRPSRSPSDKRD